MQTSSHHRTKIEELDVMRGLGFLAVVLQHVIGVFIRKPDITHEQSVMLGFLFNLSKFAVPIFVFITGMVLLYNYQKLDFPSFLWKRTKDILLPYFSWTVIYNIYYHFMPSLEIDWLKTFSKELILGTGAYHLWFVIMIFQFYLFYPALLFTFNKIKSDASMNFPIAFLAMSGMGYLGLMWFSSSLIPREDFQTSSAFINAAFIEYRDRNFLYWIFYFILGGMAGLYLPKWREFISRSQKWNPIFFLMLLFWVTYELFEPESINLNISTTLKPSMFLFTVSYIFLLYGVAVKVKDQVPALFLPLAIIGQYSYGAYLAHAFMLTYVVRFLININVSEFYLLSTLLAFILCSVLSVVFVRVISWLPFSSILVGSVNKR